MDVQRVALFSRPRLLYEMIRRVIEKTPSIEFMGEVHDVKSLDTLYSDRGLDWIIFFQTDEMDQDMEFFEFLTMHPDVRLLRIASDGSQIAVKWIEFHEIALDRVNLSDLMSLMASRQSLSGSTDCIESNLGVRLFGNIM